MLDKVIKNVLELPGVEGACLLDKKGVILLNELPEFFLADFLEDLSRRVISLYEAVDENYVPCDDYLLKYPQKYIQLRRSRNVYLLVVVDPNVNLVSLRMVTNLVLKHITPKALASLRASLAPAAETPAAETTKSDESEAAQPTSQSASQPNSQSAAQPTSQSASQPTSKSASETPQEKKTAEADVSTGESPKKRYRFYRGVKYEY